jgi:uncharacterized lipoprotein YmbA
MKAWLRLRIVGAALAPAFLLLSACGGGTPTPELYVLGDAPATKAAAVSQLGGPMVEVKRVRVADYLDTTDIVTRHAGGKIVASQGARWGERLSVGVTRAVATGLEARLPQLAVTTMAPPDGPRWQLLIDIDAFEAQPDGTSVMTARWSLRDGRGGQSLEEERVALVAPVGRGSDGEVVGAMTQQVDQLVARIAPVLETEARAALASR